MKESILQYLWQYKLFATQPLSTHDKQSVEVIHPGTLNTDAGPDFFNAKIKINQTLWVGNVEIHTKSSDWYVHQHDKDKRYDNIILHVSYKVDRPIYRENGDEIPQVELRIPTYIAKNYQSLLNEQKWIACQDKIQQVNRFFVNSCLSAMLMERLQDKTESIERLLEHSQNHWEVAFYISLARSFGFGLNSDAFEMMARQTPLSVLGKHKDNLFQIEAIYFGQSGLLQLVKEEETDEYVKKLRTEYEFLQKKYQLQPINGILWKMLRLRPDNFPHIRIAQFSQLIHQSSKLFSKILEINELSALRKLFRHDVSTYWKTHYRFGKISPKADRYIGQSSIDILLINTIIPYIFSYKKQLEQDTSIAIQLLEEIPAEKNKIIREWNKLGFKTTSAADTQALIQLYKQYCKDKKCIRCTIGHKVLTKKDNQ